MRLTYLPEKYARTFLLLLFFCCLVPPHPAFGEEAGYRKEYRPVSRKHTRSELLEDALLSYGLLWVGYTVSQYDKVRKINWEETEENLFEKGPVLYDRDAWLANFVGHPWYGSEFYLLYRSRGYTKGSSLLGMTMANIAFEFLVESTTQPPSTNDIFITSAFGGLLGYYREEWALKLLNRPGRINHGIGHVLWPETMFDFFEEVRVTPLYKREGKPAPGINIYAAF